MDFICVSVSDWSGLQTGKHHVSRELASRGHRVLYIEPAMSLLFKPGDVKFAQKKLGNLLSGVKEKESNVYVVSPFRLIPFVRKLGSLSSSVLFNELNCYLESIFARRAIKELGFSVDAVLWLWDPRRVALVDCLPHSVVVYHCGDDFAAFNHAPKGTQQLEDRLIDKADFIFVTAHELLQRISAQNPNTYLVSNAVNMHYFDPVSEADVKPPSDLQRIPNPRIGYVGSIRDWVDIDLVADTARMTQGYSFVMIGPVKETTRNRYKGIKNLYWLGRKPYEQVPHYLKGIRVALIPFKVNELTAAVDPLKLYEYFAMGLPVVSTPMPEVERFKPLVRIASTPRQFINEIRKVLNEPAEMKSARVRTARDNSWSQRVDTMLELLSSRISLH